ncbi:acyl-CoA dehydrogenase, N-terminal domain protein [Mycobacterium ulcerans str. Harvey]|uniref:Acyl-CoA dehydrogenase, N-terminal domain protein n=1 Tax=Mycobacterium ulcerans str. Harvey TaxID=1299332 RepID=A0ABN0QQE6_MYCUL|nr:acyl-CoA dehydrogenase, N-terminal domain protein [Mycobacterium ulcerans str. Harvey]
MWEQLANLGVTALTVSEKFDGLGAHPIDLVVALERLGRWCVPGPVAESIAVAPVLLADDDRSAGLACGELIATVALPPHAPEPSMPIPRAWCWWLAKAVSAKRRWRTATSPSTPAAAVTT